MKFSHSIQPLSKKLLSAILLIMIVGLLLRLFTGDGSLVHIYLLNKSVDKLELSVTQQQQRNDELLRVISSLKNDLDMVETVARRDMGMVRPDEVFFIDD